MSDIHLTYQTIGEKLLDRDELRLMLDAIDATPNAMRLDDCACWTIRGRFGYIATWGEGGGYMLVFVGGGKAKQWAFDKKRLHFCEVTSDGKDEGVMHLDRLPTKEEGTAIRIALGINQRKRYSDEHKAAAAARVRKLHK